MKSPQSTADLTTGRAMAREWTVDWELARPEHNTEKEKPAFHSRAVVTIKRIGSPRFSDDDVDAMLRICEAVDDAKEAKTIQQSVDLTSFSDIGQRTRMRVGFSRMPGGWVGG